MGQVTCITNSGCPSFTSLKSSWIPVEGTRDICNCCETRNCLTGGQPRRPVIQWNRSSRGRRVRRDVASKHGMNSSGREKCILLSSFNWEFCCDNIIPANEEF